MSLQAYRRKRDFKKTAEPAPRRRRQDRGRAFVIHKHQATRLHYDLRLEAGGVLKCWAVPRGISLDPEVKRLAIAVEDHPLQYKDFEGRIAAGSYGAGNMIIWDEGTYSCLKSDAAHDRCVRAALEKGHLDFELFGKKIGGGFTLIRLRAQENRWLLFKRRDGRARPHAQFDESSVRSRRRVEDLKVVHNKKITNPLAGIDLRGAVRSAMPRRVEPMLAAAVDEPFDRRDWIFEVKWDGYRSLAEIRKGRARLYSRRGEDQSEKFPSIAASLAGLAFDALFDGEIVVIDETGRSNFRMLQNYSGAGAGALVYYVFDLLFLAEYDLRSRPLRERRAILAKILPAAPNVRLSEAIPEDGKAFYRAARANGLEGIMAKDGNSPYRSGRRSNDWLKVKIERRQAIVIGGFTRPQHGRKYFGALITGVYEKNELRFTGHVGTGFDETDLESIWRRLQPLVTANCPFAGKPPANAAATWVRPALVAEVKFKEWTDRGIMRLPVFVGLRDDKAATAATREMPAPATRTALTNLDKIFWPRQRFTKKDLIEYYAGTAAWILPFLKDRPQALNRHPDGIDGGSFFQKNLRDPVPEFVTTVKIPAGREKKAVNYLVCQNRDTLLYLANLGCIEINTFNSVIGHLENPDYLILDFDPVAVPFSTVVDIVLATKKVLDELSLPAFCKTSGGKGMHIYIPLVPEISHDAAKDFVRVINEAVSARRPDLASPERRVRRRKGRVYLDYLQNRFGATMAAPYSLRPRDGAPVSTPLEWREVSRNLDPLDFNLRTVPERLAARGDCWRDIFKHRVDLTAVLEAIPDRSISAGPLPGMRRTGRRSRYRRS